MRVQHQRPHGHGPKHFRQLVSVSPTRGRPRLTFAAFSFSSFFSLCPVFLPFAAIHCHPLHPHPTLCLRISLSASDFNLFQPVLSIPAGDQRLVCCCGAYSQLAQLLIFLSISNTLDHTYSWSTLLLRALSLDQELPIQLSLSSLSSSD